MEELIKAIPEMAEKLGAMMATEALPLIASTGLTLDDTSASVSISFRAKDGQDIKVTLSIESTDCDDDEDNEEEL